jgi:uncharacterized protein
MEVSVSQVIPVLDQIRGLKSLADADAELAVLGQSLASEESELAALRAAVSTLQARLKTQETDLLAAEKAKGEAVQEVRSTAQQMDHSREKMSRSRTERETNAVEREIEELRRIARDREGDLERAHLRGEELRQSAATTTADLAAAQAALDAAESAKTEAVTSFRARREAMLAAREKLTKLLPPALYRKYDQVRVKRGSGVAETTAGACSACNIALAPQLFQKLRREPSLDQCPSCNRLIYFVAPAAKALEGAS